jgi:hypothetical protein
MNTGVSASNQIGLVRRGIDAVEGDLHGFWSDVERAYNDVESPAYRENPILIMRAVRERRPELVDIGFYTNWRGWNDLGQPGHWLDNFKFWYAWYPLVPQAVPVTPPGLTLEDVFLWQYSAIDNRLGAEYGVSSRDLDQNVSRISREDFLMRLQKPPEPVDIRAEKSRLLEAIIDYADAVDNLPDEHADGVLVLRRELQRHLQAAEAIVGSEPAPLYRAVVTENGLRIRSMPGLHGSIINHALAGDTYEVWEEAQGEEYTWARIKRNKQQWVASDWLKKI